MPSNAIIVGINHLCGDNMLIKSLSGKTIYRSSCRTLRGTLEEGVAKGVDFSFADLRRANLRAASIDGIVAAGASFQAADLSGADIGLGDLRKADLRGVLLKDACLAETDLSGADLSGAYFSSTILEGAVLDRVRVSCPSVWDIDITAARSVRGCVYAYQGACDMPVRSDARILRVSGDRIVLNGAYCLWRDGVYGRSNAALPQKLENDLRAVQLDIGRLLMGHNSQNAKQPIPKSAKQKTGL